MVEMQYVMKMYAPYDHLYDLALSSNEDKLAVNPDFIYGQMSLES